MNQPVKTSPADLARQLLHQSDGPLTRQLVRSPGGFGLGQVPQRLAPDATTTAVCGFCSTGCGLEVHLKGGAAVNLSPARDYPVNIGMACPKGWEALTVLKSADRATIPLVRDDKRRLVPTDWHSAMTLFCDRFKDQSNLLHLRNGEQRTELRFSRDEPVRALAAGK